MKRIIQVLLVTTITLVISSCVIISGGAVLKASSEINKSVLSAENEIFQQESGINLIVVKRGLWSMQNSYKNKMINTYFNSLLNNQLVYSINNDQEEYAKQSFSGNNINISIKISQNQNYTDYEKAILVIASTSTLALLRDTNYNKSNIPRMFFNFIQSYDDNDIPGITNTQWYKDKSISLTDNGIIIID